MTDDANSAGAVDLSERLLSPNLEEGVSFDEGLQQTWTTGEKQPSQCRDLPFAALFVIQILAVLGIAIVWGIPILDFIPSKDSTESISFYGIFYLCLLSGLAALGISALALSFMMRYAQVLVQASVLFSMSSSLVLVIIFACQGHAYAAFMAFFFFSVSACYARSIWSRIPFAASNLVTALMAVRTNLGVSFVAYGLVAIAFGWTLLWVLSIIGVYVKSSDCHTGVCEGHVKSGVVVLYLLSFYWTQQVIKNVLHVTVAGVVGTWWFDPAEASSTWSKSILDSFYRSTTSSFGSICLGSLLVALLEVLRQMVQNARDNSGGGFLSCILECVLSYLESIIEYFNRWAYIYVGLYGYSYTEAGKKVITLFRERGWTTIINDGLVSHVLAWMSLVIGGITGCIGLAVGATHKSWVSEFPEDDALWISFVTAFLLGLVIASILMSVVASAVDTVIVCFAEAPLEFQTNYPLLSENMKHAWNMAYPQEFRL